MEAEKRIDGELRYVAALMADIADSTEITERLGAERSFLLLQEIMSLSWAQIQRMHGHPLNFTGDGMFAVFGAPVAVEQASLIACRAAVAIGDLLERESGRFRQTYGVTPRMRIGIASGEVLVTGLELGGATSISVNGSAVNLASRLQNLAAVGRIACSSQVVTDVGARATFAGLGAHKLKGFVEPQLAHELVALKDELPGSSVALVRVPTLYVGRETELALIGRWIEAGSDTSCLIIEGEAGIGKSRLLTEAIRQIGDVRRPLTGGCTTETVRRPLFPLIEILRQSIGWHPGVHPTATGTAIAAILPDRQASIELLTDLVAGRESRHEDAGDDEALVMREQLMKCIQVLGTRHDLLLTVEDAHWIDPLSAGILGSLIESGIPHFRILMTRRTAPLKDWLNASQIVTLRLGPLSRDDIAKIALDRTHAKGSADAAFVDLVVDKSEGNPFFATEMLQHFDGQHSGFLKASSIGTIQNLVFARFDPLDGATKEVLRIAASIGRSFPIALLRRVAALSPAEMAAVFDRAQGLIEVRVVDGEDIGQFSHVLWRETIHGSITTTRKCAIHRLIGETMELMEHGNLSPVAETLVYHFELGDLPRKAVLYLGIAARNAHRFYALETCAAQLERAFVLIAQSPGIVEEQDFGPMLKLLVTCYDQLGSFAKLEDALTAHLPRLQRSPNNPLYPECLSMLAVAHCHKGDFRRSLELVNTAIRTAELAGQARAVATAKVVKIRIASDSGLEPLEAVQKLFDETKEVADSLVDMHLTYTRLYYFVFMHQSKGLYAGASKWTRALENLALTTRNRHALVVANWTRGVRYVLSEDMPNALAHFAESRRLAVPGTGHWIVADLGCSVARMHSGEQVPREVFTSVISRCEHFHDLTLRNAALFNLAIWHFYRGKIREGWAQLQLADWKFQETGTAETKLHARFLRAQVLLNIAGLGARSGPTPKLALGDIVKASTLRLSARRQAHRIYANVLREGADLGGFFLGRACLGLAILARANRQTDQAEQYFDQSIAHFDAEDLSHEADRVRKVAGRAAI
jgi:class 3 adenylate cyclase/tetratricopeptide (TPR) repeat protein